MTTKELKSKIKDSIESVDNIKALEMMDAILDTYKSKTIVISEKHKDFLDESGKSKLYSNEDAVKLVDKWLED
jgi:hypothetical protein